MLIPNLVAVAGHGKKIVLTVNAFIYSSQPPVAVPQVFLPVSVECIGSITKYKLLVQFENFTDRVKSHAFSSVPYIR